LSSFNLRDHKRARLVLLNEGGEVVPKLNPELAHFEQTYLCITGIDRTWSEKELAAYFSTYGKVSKCLVSKDASNEALNNGYGYVYFQEVSQAVAVIEDSLKDKIFFNVYPCC
jgi:RNA recognition motif. (a.k.a. RRM, RBD, or RNP domain)